MPTNDFIKCLFFVLMCLSQVAQASEAILEMPAKDKGATLFEYSKVLEDPTGKLRFEEVSRGEYPFKSRADGTLKPTDFYPGLTRSAFWLKVDMVNSSKENQWFIKSWGGVTKKIEAHLRSGEEKGFTELQVLDGHRGGTFGFESEYGMQHTLYLRVQDLQTPVNLFFEIYSVNLALQSIKYSHPTYAVIFGCLFILALYNLFYFLFLRDKGFLALAIFIAAFAVELGSHMGVWGYFSIIRDYLHYAGTGFGFLAVASAIAVFSHMLELKQNSPKGYRFFRIAFWGTIVLVLLAPFIYYGTAILGGIGLVLIIPAFFVIKALYFNQYKFLWSMVLSAFIFIFSVIPALLMSVGVFDIYGPLVDLAPFALMVSLVLLSLTQAEKVRNQSEQAERTLAANQAKDEFLTTMSHELRTPMHAVVGAGRLLKLTKLSDEQGALVSRLNHSSNHMMLLINDILDLARAERHLVSLEKEPFKLNDVLESLNKLLCGAAQSKGLSLSFKNYFTPFRQELVGDATRLKQVLLNLLNNAIKFTEKGDVKLIITPWHIEPHKVSLLFEVFDSGIGIQNEKLTELFKPFTQVENSTSRRYGGSGLGLAISHRLVQIMGGELNVESKIDEGSRFFFKIDLPLQAVSEEIKSSVIEPESIDVDQLSGLRVLLVDDDEMNRFFGGKLLKVCGVDAVVAESGEQALEFMEQQTFDLMLLDVSMPGMNGYQTAQEVRRRKMLSDITIVALTAHAIKGERERCLAAGMDDFLAKPFELSDLKIMLHKHARKQLLVKASGLA